MSTEFVFNAPLLPILFWGSVSLIWICTLQALFRVVWVIQSIRLELHSHVVFILQAIPRPLFLFFKIYLLYVPFCQWVFHG